jgi:hypothetical protein
MKVYYKKGEHVIIKFPSHELRQALGVLKALSKYFKSWFLVDVAADLERDLEEAKRPKLPAPPIYHHICENCFMEIDVRKDSYVHVDDTYYHAVCPVLKENRPV